MKYSILSVFILACLTINSYGQKDPEAVKVLERFSETAQKAPSVYMKFILVTNDQMEKTNDSLEGSVILSKDKYKLDLPDNIIWFNGETSWSYLPAEKEVTITKPGKRDNSFQSRPSSIFTMYKKGYKSRLIEETADSYVVDLYPEDIKSDLIRIRITIGKQRTNLISLEYKKKDGITITLVVKKYDINQKPSQDTFVFQTSQYKDVEINDIR